VNCSSSRKLQAGFSLIELLVAFAILAMSLGLIYRSMGESARNAGNLVLYQQAAMFAEGLLNSRASLTSDGWNESGERGAFQWKVTSQPFSAPANAVSGVALHQIDISVSWTEGGKSRALEVRTLLPQRKPLPGEAVK
jgi:general secretion pathway protein I